MTVFLTFLCNDDQIAIGSKWCKIIWQSCDFILVSRRVSIDTRLLILEQNPSGNFIPKNDEQTVFFKNGSNSKMPMVISPSSRHFPVLDSILFSLQPCQGEQIPCLLSSLVYLAMYQEELHIYFSRCAWHREYAYPVRTSNTRVERIWTTSSKLVEDHFSFFQVVVVSYHRHGLVNVVLFKTLPPLLKV